ncbi:MAG TPA: hypothetical protein VGN92_01115 [Mycobacterium sp.]|nr:hypothetical protein [Mycobacterium sp.]
MSSEFGAAVVGVLSAQLVAAVLRKVWAGSAHRCRLGNLPTMFGLLCAL